MDIIRFGRGEHQALLQSVWNGKPCAASLALDRQGSGYEWLAVEIRGLDHAVELIRACQGPISGLRLALWEDMGTLPQWSDQDVLLRVAGLLASRQILLFKKILIQRPKMAKARVPCTSDASAAPGYHAQPHDPPLVSGAHEDLHWLEIEMVGEDDQPVPGEAYQVEWPDGTHASGTLDDEGFARLDRFAYDAPCKIRFPGLDGDAWKWVRALSSRSARAPTPRRDAHRPGMGHAGVTHVVSQGENIDSIAFLYGYFPLTLWDHESNAHLKDERADPHVLHPGDVVHIPPLRESHYRAATDQRHRFRRRGVPSILRFRALVAGRPLSGQPYAVEVGTKVVRGTSDAEGALQCFVPPDAPSAVISVGTPPFQWTYHVRLRSVDPVTELSGVQGRLANLGFYQHDITGVLDLPTREAVRAFQGSEGLKSTGRPDEFTRRHLLLVHGS